MLSFSAWIQASCFDILGVFSDFSQKKLENALFISMIFKSNTSLLNNLVYFISHLKYEWQVLCGILWNTRANLVGKVTNFLSYLPVKHVLSSLGGAEWLPGGFPTQEALLPPELPGLVWGRHRGGQELRSWGEGNGSTLLLESFFVFLRKLRLFLLDFSCRKQRLPAQLGPEPFRRTCWASWEGRRLE